MNTKEFLSQAWNMEKQIQSKLQQIESLRSLAGKVTASWGSQLVSHSLNVTSLQDTVHRILEAEEELNRQIDDLVEMKLKIAEVISRVPDDVLRMILEKRYLCFLPWEKISEELGYSDRWVRTRHREALAAVEEILGEVTWKALLKTEIWTQPL